MSLYYASDTGLLKVKVRKSVDGMATCVVDEVILGESKHNRIAVDERLLIDEFNRAVIAFSKVARRNFRAADKLCLRAAKEREIAKRVMDKSSKMRDEILSGEAEK